MAKKTWHDRIVAYITTQGFKRDYSTPVSRKYVKYSAVDTGGKLTYYHLGSNGAVLVSRKNAVSNAVSITDRVHRRVEQWEQSVEQ